MSRKHGTFVCMIVTLCLATSGSWAFAEDPKLLDWVPPDAVVAVIARPNRVLTAPSMELLPIEVLSAAGKKELGLDPLDVDEVLVVAMVEMTTGPEPQPHVGALLRLKKSYQQSDLAPFIEKVARQSKFMVQLHDPKTLLIADSVMGAKMLANQKSPTAGPLTQMLKATDISGDLMAMAVMEPIRDLVTAGLDDAPIPPPFEDIRKVPRQLKAAKLDIRLTAGIRSSLYLLATDESAAKELEGTINQLLDTGQQMAIAQMSQEISNSDDPVEQALAQYSQRVTRTMFKMFRPNRSGTVLMLPGDQSMLSNSNAMATNGVLIALLLPAVQAARESARRAQTSNQLKQIGLAMHNYHDRYKQFPTQANYKDGKPLLSWRVHILPSIEAKPLYDRFHLDEPWDSPHNKQLIPLMPEAYRAPGSQAELGKTVFVAPIGEDTIFKADEKCRFADISDGTSNTIMVIEASDQAAVVWTKPEDWQYDASDPFQGLLGLHPGGFSALFADGSVRFISETLDPELLDKLLMKSDGQPVGQF